MNQCKHRYAGCEKFIPRDSKKKICGYCQRHIDRKKEEKKTNAPDGMKCCFRHRTGCARYIPLDGPNICDNCKAIICRYQNEKPKKEKPPPPTGMKHCAHAYAGCLKLIPVDGKATCEACSIRRAELSKKRRLAFEEKAEKEAPPAKRLCSMRIRGCQLYIHDDSETKACQNCRDKKNKQVAKKNANDSTKKKDEATQIDNYFNNRMAALGSRTRESVTEAADRLVAEGMKLLQARVDGKPGWHIYVGAGSVHYGTNYSRRRTQHPDYRYFDATTPTTDLLALGLAEIKCYYSIAAKYGVESLTQTIVRLGMVRLDCKSGKGLLYICSHAPHLKFERLKKVYLKLASTKEKNPLCESKCIEHFKLRYKVPLVGHNFKELLEASETLASEAFEKHKERVGDAKEKGKKIETYVGVGTFKNNQLTRRVFQHGRVSDWDFRDTFVADDRFVGGLAEIKLVFKIKSYQPEITNHTKTLGFVPNSQYGRKYQIYLLNKLKSGDEEKEEGEEKVIDIESSEEEEDEEKEEEIDDDKEDEIEIVEISDDDD